MLTPSSFVLTLATALGAALVTRFLIASILIPSRKSQTASAAPSFNAEQAQDVFKRAANALGNVSPVSAREAGPCRDRLSRAGLQIEPVTWRGIQIACTLIGILLSIAIVLQALDGPHVLLASIVLALALFGPNLTLRSLARDRRSQIEAAIPSSLELLSISVRSGYPLERGIRLVSQNTKGPLAREFGIVDADINLLGMSMERALKRMDKRCGTPSVKSFTTALTQAANQGTSISRVLDSQARIARNERFAALSEQVNRLPAKLVAPIFGIMMLVIVIALAPPIYDTITLFAGAYGDAGTSSVSNVMST